MDSDAGHQDSGGEDVDRFHLWSALAVVLSGIFVALLTFFAGDLGTLWPLFLIPIVVAALAYGVPGAVVATAVSALAVALMPPGAADGTPTLPDLVIGLAIFLACGVVVGAQSSRNRRHGFVLEQASVRDAATGLYKPPYLRARLAEEVRRGGRHEVDVGLVLVRVNDLRRFRDTFGSYKSDRLLEHMGDILRLAVRETDIVGRYAADAFAVVAPFAGPAETSLIAERLRGAARSAEFEGDVLEPSARCGVTVAAASFPSEAGECDELIGLAEVRLAAAAPGEATLGGAFDAAPKPGAQT
jgi:diguanylate cyclase (GGDEF)-like protein